jgi:NitT/TauT family transport system permease protein
MSDRLTKAREATFNRRQVARLLVVIIFLALWQYVPGIAVLADRYKFLNRFFISSPGKVSDRVVELLTGSDLYPSVIGPLGTTLRDTVIGVAIGMGLGALLGLLLSSSPLAAAVFRPLIVTFSSVPRIVFVPLVIVLFGPRSLSSIAVAALIVFFAVFFNAFEGGRTVKAELLDNAYILGAGPIESMARVRLPFVLAWTVVALPAAAGYGLVGTVLTQILVGVPGIGQSLTTAIATADAATTIALAFLLASLGLALTGIAALLRRTLLFWWVDGSTS